MKSSPEPGRRAVLLDANVLSRLARVHQIGILPKTFPGGCFLARAIYREIEAGIDTGVTYFEAVMDLVRQGLSSQGEITSSVHWFSEGYVAGGYYESLLMWAEDKVAEGWG